ncbi:MAG: hypothetical protein HS104_01840 [Polyangiaceae bacterium]|nr:hypothetical protein [Polyangiaceae bacterium]MCE7890624.1 hypothetical protein [Sorangiineae bacterium PRO1]MCL4755551.1 hypothetical protein [Myxococcales bacterium]
MDESHLLEKLAKIEALFAGTTSDGERGAAAEARRRILERLAEVRALDPPVDYKFTLADTWSRRVFLALCRRYELTPYRRRGQRYTTVMLKVPRRFVDETLWPEYTQLNDTLRSYLEEVTERVVSQVLQADSSEADEADEPRQLNLGGKRDAS